MGERGGTEVVLHVRGERLALAEHHPAQQPGDPARHQRVLGPRPHAIHDARQAAAPAAGRAHGRRGERRMHVARPHPLLRR
jgi:hypothetical protein